MILNRGKLLNNQLVLLEDKHFIVDMMYARKNNMVGRAVYEEIGYGNKAYMHRNVCNALQKLVPFLQENKLKMRICDAYRPPIAHRKLLEIIPMQGFFAVSAERSNHCHGTAVDVCLTDENGRNLVYPTEVDAYEKRFQQQVCRGIFDEFKQHLCKARHDYMQADEKALQNRQMLKMLMESVGFEAISHEWWHYNIQNWQNYPLVEWDKEF